MKVVHVAVKGRALRVRGKDRLCKEVASRSNLSQSEVWVRVVSLSRLSLKLLRVVMPRDPIPPGQLGGSSGFVWYWQG